MSEIKTSDLSTLAQSHPAIAEHLTVSQGGDSWALYQEQFMQATSFQLALPQGYWDRLCFRWNILLV